MQMRVQSRHRHCTLCVTTAWLHTVLRITHCLLMRVGMQDKPCLAAELFRVASRAMQGHCEGLDSSLAALQCNMSADIALLGALGMSKYIELYGHLLSDLPRLVTCLFMERLPVQATMRPLLFQAICFVCADSCASVRTSTLVALQQL